MKIPTVFSHIVIFLSSVTSFVSSASIPTKCKIPTNLKFRYKRLSRAAVGNKFFLPARVTPVGSNQKPLIVGDTTCPTSSASIDIIRERSTCPWYVNITHDSTVFPSSRTEVVCRCRGCRDFSSSKYQCVTVYTKMTVLKRTNKCVARLYVYKPIVINVGTACVCARKIDGYKNDKYASYET
ncbi:interleukin 17-like protein isoform X2 [Octopus sinensis]|uniref:Interleukin 17-like protein isoform X2 n=1 Tax=Octopus sinensis TaxID=2607531 RepID=A0A7E6FTT0_9MOLL|nr:interleukin 17-like protein isoform X2 [Octopus sinensis]